MGVLHWCSLATASQVSQKICRTSLSVKPVCRRWFIRFTTCPPGRDRITAGTVSSGHPKSQHTHTQSELWPPQTQSLHHPWSWAAPQTRAPQSAHEELKLNSQQTSPGGCLRCAHSARFIPLHPRGLQNLWAGVTAHPGSEQTFTPAPTAHLALAVSALKSF